MLKRKNDRQPPQRLEEECYPNDYWLDEEDGGEDIPDLAVSSKPVSGRLHSEPMVTGYEALERQRGVRRPNRKPVSYTHLAKFPVFIKLKQRITVYAITPNNAECMLSDIWIFATKTA